MGYLVENFTVTDTKTLVMLHKIHKSVSNLTGNIMQMNKIYHILYV